MKKSLPVPPSSFCNTSSRIPVAALLFFLLITNPISLAGQFDLSIAESFILGGNSVDALHDMKFTADGNLLIAGNTDSRDNDFDGVTIANQAFVMKVSLAGQKLWSLDYGGSNTEYFFAVMEASDGNIYAVGKTNSVDNGFQTQGGDDILLAKISPAGSKIWTRNYGGANHDVGYGVHEGADGNIVVIGSALSAYAGSSGDVPVNSYPGSKLWFFKVDPMNGDIVPGTNVIRYGGQDGSANYNYYPVKSVPEQSGRYAVVGATTGPLSSACTPSPSSSQNALLLILDETGTIISEGIYGASATQYAWDVLVDDSGYLLVGSSAYADAECDVPADNANMDNYWIKTDLNLGVEWTRSYGGLYDDRSTGILSLQGNNFLICSLGGTPTQGTQVALTAYNNSGFDLNQQIFGGSKYDGRISNILTVPYHPILARDHFGNIWLGASSESSDGDVPSNNYTNYNIWISKLDMNNLSITPYVDLQENPSACGMEDWEYEDCISPDLGPSAGQLRVPLKMQVGSAASANPLLLEKLNNIVADVNSIFSSNNVPIAFFISATFIYPDPSNDYIATLDCSNPNRNQNFSWFETIYGETQNQGVINVFIVDEIVTEQSCDRSGVTLGGLSILGVHEAVWITDEIISIELGSTLAHELAHLLGLYHTFENRFFSNENACKMDDGIWDTDPNPDGMPSASGNLMDYEDTDSGNVFSETPDITPCQQAKMLDVLMESDWGLCTNPEQPDVRINSENGLSVNILEYNLNQLQNDGLDTLFSVLPESNRTNTGNSAFWQLENTIYESQGSSVNLNDLYSEGYITAPGEYTLRLRDQSIYNSSCVSPWTTVIIRINQLSQPVITYNGAVNFCSLSNVDCAADATFTFSVADLCNDPAALVQASWYPFGDDNAQAIPLSVVGNYPDYSATGRIPLGTHLLRIYVEDDCGGIDEEDIYFSIIDCLPPTPSCSLEGLTIELMATAPGTDVDGDNIDDPAAATIFATQFITAPSGDCSGPATYTINRVGETPDIAQESIVLTCKDPAILVLEIYAWDSAGNSDFCESHVIIEDNSGLCEGAACSDGIQNGDETGVDCGGSCPPCDEGCFTDDLIASYPFDGAADDVSGNGFHGELFGPILTTGRLGDADAAYWFDGQNDEIRINNPFGNNISDALPFSLSAWIKTGTMKPTAILFSYSTRCYNNGDDDDYFSLSLSGDELKFANGSGGLAGVSVPELFDDQYHHIGISSNGTAVTLYLDGVNIGFFDNLSVDLVNIPTDYDLVIGSTHINSCGDAPFFQGAIDEVTIYTRTLSDREMSRIYNDEDCLDCSAFTDVTDPELLNAVSCLCELDYITPQDYGNGNTNGVNPNEAIYRADLAKVVYYALFNHGITTNNPVLHYPTPFTDLEEHPDYQGNPYYDYGKILSYLAYEDEATPFDQKFMNFNPYNSIEKRYALKVILEAFNIPPDHGAAHELVAPYMQADEDGYGYVNKAAKDGLITDASDYKQDISRGNLFIILHRLILNRNAGGGCASIEGTVTIEDTDYLEPGNFLSQLLSRSIGMEEGFFTHSAKPSFFIPGLNLPLKFQHFYNAHLTDLPENIRKLEPLGRGWSHTYHAYLVEEKSVDEMDSITNNKLFAVWPGGRVDRYDKASLASESILVFDTLIQNGDGYIIRKKNQVEFAFDPFNVIADGISTTVWMLASIKDRNNNTVTINVLQGEAAPIIESITGTAGRQLIFTYAESTNYLQSVIDVAGIRAVFFDVDTLSKDLLTYINPKQDTTYYHYGAGRKMHLLESIQMPKGNIITADYDLNRKLTEVKFPGVQEPFQFNTTTAYSDPNANYATRIANPDNGQYPAVNVRAVFNDKQQLMERTIGNLQTKFSDFNSIDLPETLTYGSVDAPSEQVSTDMTYDSQGNVLSIDLPMGVRHVFTYTNLNDIETYQDPRGNITRFTYVDGNIDFVEDNMGFKTDYTLNEMGLLTAVTTPDTIALVFDYDNFGNQTAAHAPLDINTTLNYDPIGRLTRIINAESQITEYSYDAHDLTRQMTRFSDAGNIVSKYNYDKNDNLTEIENALGFKTTLTYDERDLLKTMQFGDDQTVYNYRSDNLLDNYVKPNDTIMQMTYDDKGRLTSDGYVEEYAYDSRSNLKTVTKDGLTTTFAYDSLDRVDYYTDIYGKVVDYDYDGNSNITQITYPGDFVVNYEYDPNNRLQFVRWNNNARQVAYSYFKDGRLKRVDYPNGTYCQYNYDAAGRMTGMTTYKSNHTDTICAYTFDLDKLGNHLEEIKNEPFGLPNLAAGNVSGTYNNENEVTAYAGETFAFDANGNQTDKSGLTAEWDKNDMMTRYGNKQYEYDGLGQLRKANRDGAVVKYVWDIAGMGNILMETDDAGNPLNYYIHGLGLVARINAQTSAEHFYHYDFRGSTVAMTDADQNITHHYSYLPYGELLQEQEADPNPFKFVGQWGVMAEGDDLYYMRARFYDAQTGRFLSEDPVWGENLYRYGGNNPIIKTDPSGNYSLLVDKLTYRYIQNEDRAGPMVATITLGVEIVTIGLGEVVGILLTGQPGVGSTVVGTSISGVGFMIDNIDDIIDMGDKLAFYMADNLIEGTKDIDTLLDLAEEKTNQLIDNTLGKVVKKTGNWYKNFKAFGNDWQKQVNFFRLWEYSQ